MVGNLACVGFEHVFPTVTAQVSFCCDIQICLLISVLNLLAQNKWTLVHLFYF